MLQIFITNNIRIRGATTPLRAAVTKALTYDNPAYVIAKKKRRRTWGVDPKIELFIYDKGDIVTPRGFKSDLEDILKQQGYDPEKTFIIKQTEGLGAAYFGPWNPDYTLKEDQTPLVAAAMEANGIAVAPAGSGKTVMGMRYIYEKGRPALWLTHTKDLMYQSAERAKATLKDVGRIGYFGDGKHTWGDGKLIIATVQTLQRNPDLIKDLNQVIGTVVVDEAHHFPAVQFIETVAKLTAKNIIGLTATPNRKDGLDVYMYRGIGPKLYEITRDGLYDSGRLVKPEVKFIYTDFDHEQASDRNAIDSVDAGGEDLDYVGLIRTLINDEKRAKLIAESILEASPLGPAIVITESVRYCFILQDLVNKMAKARHGKDLRTAVVHGGISRYKWVYNFEWYGGWIAEKLDKNGKTQYQVENYTAAEFDAWQVTPQRRRDILEACGRKEIDILFATQLAREGLDMPHLNVGHMVMPKRGDASGSGNGASVEQEIGRIMRPDRNNPDKKTVWYDYVDYKVGVFKDQYQSRRSVYKRLGIPLPKKPRTEKDQIVDFLGSGALFDLPL